MEIDLVDVQGPTVQDLPHSTDSILASMEINSDVHGGRDEGTPNFLTGISFL